jgi:hypothetical protein
MMQRRFLAPALRWLLPFLMLLLIVGHVCELIEYADSVTPPHLTAGAGYAAEGHEHEHDISCDAVEALPSSAAAFSAPYVEASQAVQAGLPPSLPVQIAPALLQDAKWPPSRPPLFVLHASLLI